MSETQQYIQAGKLIQSAPRSGTGIRSECQRLSRSHQTKSPLDVLTTMFAIAVSAIKRSAAQEQQLVTCQVQAATLAAPNAKNKEST